jgi:uncharacterized alkaline shock family protein YloU
MQYETKNSIGAITVNGAVLGAIIKREIAGFEGRAILCDSNGKLYKKHNYLRVMPVNSESAFFESEWDENGLWLRVFIVIRFGSSIRLIADRLIDGLYARISELLGIDSPRLSVVVVGIISKNLAKRNIEVTRP